MGVAVDIIRVLVGCSAGALLLLVCCCCFDLKIFDSIVVFCITSFCLEVVDCSLEFIFRCLIIIIIPSLKF